MFGLEQPLALLLLPLALLPLVFHGQRPLAHASLASLPRDPLSAAVDCSLRAVGAASIVALTLGIAGVYRAEETVERIGLGAQVVMLIDSSGSMDRPYVIGNKGTSRAPVWGTYRSKGQIARELLAAYAARRPQDMNALFVFSSNPIAVLPLTDKPAAIRAAIEAGTIERGLATTDLGAGIIRSLEFFAQQPFTGSRIMLLVSDGSAVLTIPIQDRIRNLLEQYRVTLYWLYMRDQHSPGLQPGRNGATAPEQQVHAFFSGMGLPYRAFAAEDPSALRDAIAEVDRLQNLPIRYQDIVPRVDLSGWCYALALAGLLVSLLARLAEVDAWA
ncbi:MAG TPA: vWA domain-containing protein [Gammaproteobacteria bacterium]|nr:vWA domain-containing protein [Gammaproteobacteria bacterium]